MLYALNEFIEIPLSARYCVARRCGEKEPEKAVGQTSLRNERGLIPRGTRKKEVDDGTWCEKNAPEREEVIERVGPSLGIGETTTFYTPKIVGRAPLNSNRAPQKRVYQLVCLLGFGNARRVRSSSLIP
jgi:hypothetical protein